MPMDQNTLVMVADYQGLVVGAALTRIDGFAAHVLALAVRPQYQRQGIARALMSWALDAARRFTSVVYLEVEVTNHSAIRLYTALGFSIVRTIRNYYGFGRHAYTMVRQDSYQPSAFSGQDGIRN